MFSRSHFVECRTLLRASHGYRICIIDHRRHNIFLHMYGKRNYHRKNVSNSNVRPKE